MLIIFVLVIEKYPAFRKEQIGLNLFSPRFYAHMNPKVVMFPAVRRPCLQSKVNKAFLYRAQLRKC